MSLPVLASGGFEAPGPDNFWYPFIGDGAFAITRPMFGLALSMVLLVGLILLAVRRLELVPGKVQFAAEYVYGFIRNTIALDQLGAREFLKWVPLLLTQFLLIFVNNLFGIIPAIQFPTFSRFGFALAITLVVYVIYHYVGIRRKGLGGYFKGMVPAGLPTAIVPFIFLLELLTYFVTRPLTLSLRLFANMFAGHLLLLVFFLGAEYMLLHGDNLFVRVASVGSFAMGIAFTFFELLIQFLQAYVFVLLTTSYIASSLSDDH